MRLSRRRFVSAAVALPAAWLVAACTSGETQPDATEPAADGPARQPTQDPDVAVLEDATAVVTGLSQLVSQAIAERPALAPTLQPVLDTHSRHAEVLGAANQAPASTPTSTPGVPPAALPAGRSRVLSLVASAEDRAAAAHRNQVRRAESGQFASLLASISAAESQLAVVVAEAAR